MTARFTASDLHLPGKVFIGIDPDLIKSGVAYWFKNDKQLRVETMSHFQLIEHLKTLVSIGTNFEVIIEAGWLNKKSNFRTTQNRAIGERIAKNVGENVAAGKLIEQACQGLKIEYQLVQPRSSKVSSKFFEQLTGLKVKNQEMMDAAMLVFGI